MPTRFVGDSLSIVSEGYGDPVDRADLLQTLTFGGLVVPDLWRPFCEFPSNDVGEEEVALLIHGGGEARFPIVCR